MGDMPVPTAKDEIPKVPAEVQLSTPRLPSLPVVDAPSRHSSWEPSPAPPLPGQEANDTHHAYLHDQNEDEGANSPSTSKDKGKGKAVPNDAMDVDKPDDVPPPAITDTKDKLRPRNVNKIDKNTGRQPVDKKKRKKVKSAAKPSHVALVGSSSDHHSVIIDLTGDVCVHSTIVSPHLLKYLPCRTLVNLSSRISK
jgi:hypothetical protein